MIQKPYENQVIEQVWFSGVHSDVGGGYKERSHSDIAFKWMIEKIRGKVHLNDSDYPYGADISKPIHDSYKIFYGDKERRVASASNKHTKCVHSSVLKKIQSRPDYRPLALVDMEDRNNLAPYEIVD